MVNGGRNLRHEAHLGKAEAGKKGRSLLFNKMSIRWERLQELKFQFGCFRTDCLVLAELMRAALLAEA